MIALSACETGWYRDSIVEFVVTCGCGVWGGTPIDARYTEMVLHETIYLQPVLFSALGARLFERSLTWQSSGTTVATVVTSAVSFTALYAGAYHTCGITTDGDAYCWGANYSGQLWQFSTTFSATPLKVIGQLLASRASNLRTKP